MGKIGNTDLMNWASAGTPVAKSDGDGLTFTMSAKQAASKAGTWVLRYRAPGAKSQKEYQIGSYPVLSWRVSPVKIGMSCCLGALLREFFPPGDFLPGQPGHFVPDALPCVVLRTKVGAPVCPDTVIFSAKFCPPAESLAACVVRLARIFWNRK